MPSIKTHAWEMVTETAMVKNHKEKYNSEENMLVKKDSSNWFGDLFLVMDSSVQNIQILSVILRSNLA